MLILSRTVRFAINPPQHADETGFSGVNGYGGVPAMRGLGHYFEFNVRCCGQPDSHTGYLVNIKDLDHAVRKHLIPRIERACNAEVGTDPASLMPELLRLLNGAGVREGEPASKRFPAGKPPPVSCSALRWRLTPYYSVEMTAADPNTVLLRQRFDFAASHRLHVASMSDAENRALFGKCNNPGGHGHNYQFEPCMSVPLAADGRPTFSLAQLEGLASEAIVDRFDHKHLNLDTTEFCPEKGGLNPTVENIAMVFYDLFAAALKTAGTPATLHSMTVWETDRTSATYPA